MEKRRRQSINFPNLKNRRDWRLFKKKLADLEPLLGAIFSQLRRVIQGGSKILRRFPRTRQGPPLFD